VSVAALVRAVVAALPADATRVAVVAPGGNRLAHALTARLGSPPADDALAAAVVVFTGQRGDPATRQPVLARARDRLAAGGTLVVVDHNQPRFVARRALATVLLCARGLRPARARYPVAREVAALGLVIHRLELACGERMQIVVARRG
jgi:hypothetical protein